MDFDKYTERDVLQYCLGATLYMPGTKDIKDKVLNHQLDVTSLVMCCEDAIKEEDLPAACVFLAVGQKPQNEAVQGLLELTPEGYVPAGEDALTPVPGLFAAGDCRRKTVRQLTTAVSDGASAVLAACDYLKEIGF